MCWSLSNGGQIFQESGNAMMTPAPAVCHDNAVKGDSVKSRLGTNLEHNQTGEYAKSADSGIRGKKAKKWHGSFMSMQH